jgi:hypothetical protein
VNDLREAVMGVLNLASKILIIVVSVILLVCTAAMLALMIYFMVGENVMDLIEVFGQNKLSVVMYVLYGALGFLLVVSVIGVVGVCCKSKCLLALYSVCIVICLLATFTLAVMWFWYGSIAVDHAEREMNDTLVFEYKDEFSTDAVSIAWNLAQVQLESCGVNGPNDWLYSSWYAANPTLQTVVNQTFPATCCKGAKSSIGSISDVAKGNVSPDDFDLEFLKACYAVDDNGNPTGDEMQANTRGTKSQFVSLLKKSIYIVAGIGLGTVILQLLLVLAGCHLVRSEDFGN